MRIKITLEIFNYYFKIIKENIPIKYFNYLNIIKIYYFK
jgi:hypothetical protein